MYMNTLETPLEIVNTRTATKYSVEFRNLILHKEITLLIHLFSDDNHTPIKSIQYKLEGDEYNQWGDDDSYIEIIVKREIQKLYPIADPIEEPLAEPLAEPVVEPVVEPLVEPVVEEPTGV